MVNKTPSFTAMVGNRSSFHTSSEISQHLQDQLARNLFSRQWLLGNLTPLDFSISFEIRFFIFVLEWNSLTNNRWISTKFGPNIHVPHRMNSNTFGDPLTLPPASPAGVFIYPVKYLKSYFIYWETLWFRHSWPPDSESWCLWCFLDFLSNTIFRSVVRHLD